MIQVVAVWLTLLSSPTPISTVQAGQSYYVHIMVKNTTGVPQPGRTWFMLDASEWYGDYVYADWLTDNSWFTRIPVAQKTGSYFLTATAFEAIPQASTQVTVLPPVSLIYLPGIQRSQGATVCVGSICAPWP